MSGAFQTIIMDNGNRLNLYNLPAFSPFLPSCSNLKQAMALSDHIPTGMKRIPARAPSA
jgi:hypothetical protein